MSDRKDLKVFLYVFRVLMTGIHLMRTGEVEANLLVLNTEFRLAYVDELVDRQPTQGERDPPRWRSGALRSRSRAVEWRAPRGRRGQ